MTDSQDNYQVAKTDSQPWAPQGAALQTGYNRATDWFNSSSPSFYPNATYVPASNETNQSLDLATNRATAGSPNVRAAQAQNLSTINGDYLSGENPYFRNMVTQLGDAIQPQLQSRFGSSGNLDSSAFANAFTSSLADQAGKLAFQNYSNERTNQMNAVNQAPTLANQDYTDIGQLAQVGQTREGYANQQLQDQINRFNFDQNKEGNKVAQYLAMVGGGSFGGQNTQTIPTTSNGLATGLGAASSVAGILGSLLGRNGILR